MKDNERKKSSNKGQVKGTGKAERSDVKPHQAVISKTSVNGRETERRTSVGGKDSINTGKGPKTIDNSHEAHKNKTRALCSSNYSSSETVTDSNQQKITTYVKKNTANGHSFNSEMEHFKQKDDSSDSEVTYDCGNHKGDSLVAEVDREDISSVENVKCHFSATEEVKYSRKYENSDFLRTSFDNSARLEELPSKLVPESSEEREKETIDKASICSQNVVSEEEANSPNENHNFHHKEYLGRKIEELAERISTLESELRVVAALEFSLYSIVPEHGSSSQKVHTPARRLSRLYIHSSKHWTQDKRATIARNTISGLVLIAKSCGSDVPRLTFWLSNIIVFREVIHQVFGNSNQSGLLVRLTESGGKSAKGDGRFRTARWKTSFSSKQVSTPCLSHFAGDWQETGTLTAALEKLESWIFFRIVESIWWQTLTPKMHSTIECLLINKNSGRPQGPSMVDLQQGSFSADLWKNAFSDAFERICPVRSNGLECGCIPSLARLVMEECVARLDVAMFNAILRESVHEIPTDPVSDPIIDSRVLPIQAGDLSFRSGAQLKNTVGKWRGWMTDVIGRQISRIPENENKEGNNMRDAEAKRFFLLNSLSDLLMLPKDMLVDSSIRKEVCPPIGLVLMKRILCNFTPDEFCPDPVPGVVLEVLNAESTKEEGEEEGRGAFPHPAAAVEYLPPPHCSADVRQRVAEVAGGDDFEEFEGFGPPSGSEDVRYDLLRGVLLLSSSP